MALSRLSQSWDALWPIGEYVSDAPVSDKLTMWKCLQPYRATQDLEKVPRALVDYNHAVRTLIMPKDCVV